MPIQLHGFPASEDRWELLIRLVQNNHHPNSTIVVHLLPISQDHSEKYVESMLEALRLKLSETIGPGITVEPVTVSGAMETFGFWITRNTPTKEK